MQQVLCRPVRKKSSMVCSAAAAGVAGGTGPADDGATGFARVVLPTALALLLCNMDRICLRWVCL